MKFLEWGIKDNDFGIPQTARSAVKERYIRVYLPWFRKRYCFNTDEELPMQPCFHVYWHPHPGSHGMCTVARWGWQ
jgi:hypothetical protein